jgi:hypothetical protein
MNIFSFVMAITFLTSHLFIAYGEEFINPELSIPDQITTWIPPRTVDSVNIPAFLGRWYQMYASLIPNTTFEKNGYCLIADYSPVPSNADANEAFGVRNSQR